MPCEASTRPGAPGITSGIVGALHDDVGPLVELEAVHDEQVGPAHLDHEARPHLEVVRILIAAREGVDLDEVAPDRLGERLEVGGGRDDADLVGGRRAPGEDAEGEEDEGNGA